MNQKLILKKCLKCNALVEVIDNCNCENCGIICCGEPMREITTLEKDASLEKHLPTYKIEGNNIVVKVDHVMEENHYISMISIRTPEETYTKTFTPNDIPELTYPLKENMIIYSYCNKHGLAKIEVKKDK